MIHYLTHMKIQNNFMQIAVWRRESQHQKTEGYEHFFCWQLALEKKSHLKLHNCALNDAMQVKKLRNFFFLWTDKWCKSLKFLL